jgi:hypothetical protein
MILRFDLRMDGLKLEDGSADDWLKQGQALFEYGDFEGAIALLGTETKRSMGILKGRSHYLAPKPSRWLC